MKLKRMFEKMSELFVVGFFFYYVVWLNIGKRLLFILQKFYYSFWDFVKSDRILTVLCFLGFVSLLVFLIASIFSYDEGLEKKEEAEE